MDNTAQSGGIWTVSGPPLNSISTFLQPLGTVGASFLFAGMAVLLLSIFSDGFRRTRSRIMIVGE
jgi:hypothetical protein